MKCQNLCSTFPACIGWRLVDPIFQVWIIHIDRNGTKTQNQEPICFSLKHCFTKTQTYLLGTFIIQGMELGTLHMFISLDVNLSPDMLLSLLKGWERVMLKEGKPLAHDLIAKMPELDFTFNYTNLISSFLN